ncbi:hypothetical protein Vi05172_g7293 [Venturia inaequalis]|nr:hypothetical protein Vi05172_g7293 [Venturia inaequalis]
MYNREANAEIIWPNATRTQLSTCTVTMSLLGQ